MKRALWKMNALRDQSSASCYRVEHHEAGTVRCLGTLTDVPAHHATLDPFVSTLVRRGATGYVVLINDATGTIVARRQVQVFPSKAGDRFRQFNS